MRPLALFFYVVGCGAPLALVCADPNMQASALVYGGVLALALLAFWLAAKLDDSEPLCCGEVREDWRYHATSCPYRAAASRAEARGEW